MIFELEPEKQFENQILEKKFYDASIFRIETSTTRQIFNHEFYNASDLNQVFNNASDFALKFSQHVRLWIKNFSTCQTSNQHFKHASGFELNILQRVRFRVNLCRLPSFMRSSK